MSSCSFIYQVISCLELKVGIAPTPSDYETDVLLFILFQRVEPAPEIKSGSHPYQGSVISLYYAGKYHLL